MSDDWPIYVTEHALERAELRFARLNGAPWTPDEIRATAFEWVLHDVRDALKGGRLAADPPPNRDPGIRLMPPWAPERRRRLFAWPAEEIVSYIYVLATDRGHNFAVVTILAPDADDEP